MPLSLLALDYVAPKTESKLPVDSRFVVHAVVSSVAPPASFILVLAD